MHQPKAPPGGKQHQSDDENRHKHDLRQNLVGELRLQGVQVDRFVIEVGIHILLNQGGEHIDVVFKLGLTFVIASDCLNLADLLLQIFAQVQHAGNCQTAFLLRGGAQQAPGQKLGVLHLCDGQALGILAFNDIVVHFQVNGFLEILIKFRGGGHVVQKSLVMPVVGGQQP
ncbi:hypothetical protein SDC9_141959 [bioreactor metagenome]|uniref:Uncharacterized protein n=1 Tax=bioreactor metagenome TaxID=1076179 RepID=A0A645DZT5_9ZZZZ